jgi:hypothetical protein
MMRTNPAHGSGSSHPGFSGPVRGPAVVIPSPDSVCFPAPCARFESRSSILQGNRAPDYTFHRPLAFVMEAIFGSD